MKTLKILVKLIRNCPRAHAITYTNFIRSGSSRGPSRQPSTTVFSQAQCFTPNWARSCWSWQTHHDAEAGNLSLLTIGQCGSIEDNDVYSLLHCITSFKRFKLACINVNSLCKHIDGIRYILINSPLEVLAINESKLVIPWSIYSWLYYNPQGP